MNFHFKKMEERHQKAVADILNYYIEHTTAAYRAEAIDEEFAHNFLEGPDITCSFVIQSDAGEVVGFCTLEPFMAVSTFSEAADVMYFMHCEYTGKGAGGLALKKMEEEARKRGIKKLLVDISTENSGSIEFHKKNGFIEYGRSPDIGRKLGRSFGIVYLAKEI